MNYRRPPAGWTGVVKTDWGKLRVWESADVAVFYCTGLDLPIYSHNSLFARKILPCRRLPDWEQRDLAMSVVTPTHHLVHRYNEAAFRVRGNPEVV